MTCLQRWVREHTTAGFRQAVRGAVSGLWVAFSLQRRHLSSSRRARRMLIHAPLKLNLGCGTNRKAGWVNIDLFGDADLRLDLREALPFPDESVSIVHSEHFLDLLDYPEGALRSLREAFRVLLPAGIYSVGLADSEWPVTAYARRDEEYFRIAKERLHPATCVTRMDHLDFHFRDDCSNRWGGRSHAYDFETLARLLTRAGFEHVERRDFDPSLDTEARRMGTLYVSARKPLGATPP
jgi:predicted SAM-dependent methyltransferase